MKSTYASVKPFPNSTHSSKARVDPFSLISMTDHNEDIDPYDWCDTRTHNAVCEAVKLWIDQLYTLTPPQGPDQNRVRIDTPLPRAFQKHQLWVSEVKKPDLQFRTTNLQHILVQFEIMSSLDEESTKLKLAYDLIDQLRFLKNNINSDIKKCSGFYWPVGCGCVQLCVLEWMDDIFLYMMKSFFLEERNIESTLRDVVRQAERDLGRGTAHTAFTLPMSITYMQNTFGMHAHQVHSGESVVIVNPSEQRVYKKPLRRRDTENLDRLLRNGIYLTQSVLPLDKKKEYYSFQLYEKPQALSWIRSRLVKYITSLVGAIGELHNVNLAHLDIRVDNICFTPEGKAMLIDLDRSMPCNTDALIPQGLYGKSHMYKCSRDTWKAEQLDWKQLGLVILLIQNPSLDIHRGDLPLPLPHDFVKWLINEGEFKDEYFLTWCTETLATL